MLEVATILGVLALIFNELYKRHEKRIRNAMCEIDEFYSDVHELLDEGYDVFAAFRDAAEDGMFTKAELELLKQQAEECIEVVKGKLDGED